jgi:tetratricopeptide (TPR) repeat protein
MSTKLITYIASATTLIGAVLACCWCDGASPEAENAYQQGKKAFSRNDFDAAIRCCNEAIRLDPKDADAYCYRGLAYGDQGEHDKAIADFTEAIRLDPKCAAAYLCRGEAYPRKKRHGVCGPSCGVSGFASGQE